MANYPSGGYSDDFLEQIMVIPSYNGLSNPDGTTSEAASQLSDGAQLPLFPLGLSLENGQHESHEYGEFVFSKHLRPHSVRHAVQQMHQGFQGQPTTSTVVTVSHLPNMRPMVRVRQGQATDPHSIAEWLRRERIAELMRVLQEVVRSCSKVSIILPDPFHED